MPPIRIEIISDVDDATGDIKRVNTSLGDLSKQGKASGLSLTDLKSGLDLASGAFRAVEGAVKSVIDPFVDYANQVEDLGRNAGLTAKQSSVLLNVADDLRIEFTTLKTAARELNKDGIQPSFENLRDLARQYQAIPDPVERARFATDHFGRSAQEMTKFLETSVDKLDEMGRAVEASGLVIDEAGVAKAREYQKALDDWDDSLLAVKITLAEGLLPTLSGMLKTGASVVQIQQAQTKAIMDSNGNLLDLVGTYAHYAKLSAEVVLTDKTMSDALDEITRATAGASLAASDHGDKLNEVETKTYDVERATQAATDRYQGMADAYRDKAMEVAAADADYLADRTRAVADANDAMEKKHRSWLDGVAGDVINALHEAGVEGDLYLAALHGIDATYGTNLEAEDNYHKQLAAITAEFAKSGDVTAYDIALKRLADNGASEAAARLEDADAAAVALNAHLAATPKDININVRTNYSSYGEPGPGAPQAVGPEDHPGAPGTGFASGVDFVVPPGYPNDSYPMRVQSGERVIVMPAGNTTNFNVSATYGYQSEKRLADDVRRLSLLQH